MTDSDDIIVLTSDKPEDKLEDEPSAARPLWFFALVGGVVLGFSIAFAASWYIRPPSVDIAPLEAEIEALQADIAALKAKPDSPIVDLVPIIHRIAALEERPAVDPLNEDIVSRLEALQADGFEILEIPEFPDIDDLNARIAALETELAELNAKVESGISAQLIERPVIFDPATLPRFPAEALRDGAQQLSGSGFLRRTFSRHVRVKGSDDPEMLIAGIQTDIASGNVRAALDKFDRLPPRLQSLARGWRADMEEATP